MCSTKSSHYWVVWAALFCRQGNCLFFFFSSIDDNTYD